MIKTKMLALLIITVAYAPGATQSLLHGEDKVQPSWKRKSICVVTTALASLLVCGLPRHNMLKMNIASDELTQLNELPNSPSFIEEFLVNQSTWGKCIGGKKGLSDGPNIETCLRNMTSETGCISSMNGKCTVYNDGKIQENLVKTATATLDMEGNGGGFGGWDMGSQCKTGGVWGNPETIYEISPGQSYGFWWNKYDGTDTSCLPYCEHNGKSSSGSGFMFWTGYASCCQHDEETGKCTWHGEVVGCNFNIGCGTGITDALLKEGAQLVRQIVPNKEASAMKASLNEIEQHQKAINDDLTHKSELAAVQNNIKNAEERKQEDYAEIERLKTEILSLGETEEKESENEKKIVRLRGSMSAMDAHQKEEERALQESKNELNNLKKKVLQ